MKSLESPFTSLKFEEPRFTLPKSEILSVKPLPRTSIIPQVRICTRKCCLRVFATNNNCMDDDVGSRDPHVRSMEVKGEGVGDCSCNDQGGAVQVETKGETVKGKAENVATEGTGTSLLNSLNIFSILMVQLVTGPLKEQVLHYLKAVSSVARFELLLQTLSGTMILLLIRRSYQMPAVYAFMIIVPFVILLAEIHEVPWNLFFFGTLGVTALSTVGQRCLVDVISGLRLRVQKPFSLGDFIKVGKSEGVVHKIGLLDTVLVNEKGSEDTVRNSHCFESDIKKFATAWRIVKIGIPFQIGHLDEANEVMKVIVNILKTKFESKMKKNTICRFSKIDGLMVEFLFMYSFTNLPEIEGRIFEDEWELILQLYKELEERVSNAKKLQIQPIQ